MQSLDQDLADKARSKYDPAAELDAQHYLEEVAQVRFDPNLSFADNLRNGVILCKAINAIMPNDPIKQKISESRLPFKQMENIHLYLEKTKQLGMPSFESFQTVDLFEAKNINQVINSIFSLSRQAAKYGYTQVPTLGPQLAQKTERQFTESQLAEGRAAVPLLQGFAAPVSQAGMGAMGGSRQVYNPIIGTGDTSVSSSFFAAGEVGRRADLGGAMGSRREIGGVYLDSPLFRGAPLSPLSPMSPSTRTALRSSGGDSDVFCATEELLSDLNGADSAYPDSHDEEDDEVVVVVDTSDDDAPGSNIFHLSKSTAKMALSGPAATNNTPVATIMRREE